MSLINLSFCLIASFAKTASQGFNATQVVNRIKNAPYYDQIRCKNIVFGLDPDAPGLFSLGQVSRSEEKSRVQAVCNPNYDGGYQPGEIYIFLRHVSENVLAGCNKKSTCFELCSTSIPVLREYHVPLHNTTEWMCGTIKGITGYLYDQFAEKIGLVKHSQNQPYVDPLKNLLLKEEL